MRKLIVYVSGCSGVGKNTLINGLIEKGEDVKFLISYTTREKRDFEVADAQYHFVSKEEFVALKEQGKILESDMYNGNCYGHCLDSIEEGLRQHDAVIKDLTVNGVKQSIKNIGDEYNIVPIFLTESKTVIKKRLAGRGEKQIKNRMANYDMEHKAIPDFKYVVRNNIKDVTVSVVQALLDMEKKGETMEYARDPRRLSKSKIDKTVLKILNGKTPKKIEAVLKNGKFYIVKGEYTFIASKRLGRNIPIYIVDKKASVKGSKSDIWHDILEGRD